MTLVVLQTYTCSRIMFKFDLSKMHRLIVIATIFLQLFVQAHSRREGSHQSFQIDDNLMSRMCQLRLCQHNATCRIAIQSCRQHLLPLNKPGDCPVVSTTGDTLCLNECSGHDYRCSGTQKCCSHTCGRSCIEPIYLDALALLLLPIPHHLSIEDVPRQRNSAELSWIMDMPALMSEPQPMYFVVEARAHVGFTYAKYRLSKWFNISFEITSSSSRSFQMEYNAIVRLRCGRWYEFRLAALNENGILGYSTPSSPFQLKERPKNPSVPRDFKVAVPPRRTANGTVYVKVVWRQPRTEYVIEKYRISWALHLRSANGSLITESLWYNEAYIQEPIRFYEFENLAPNSFYYIQLQALSSFGRKKLKSPKLSQLLNTTIVDMLNGNGTWSLSSASTASQSNHSSPVIRILANKKYGMVVRIIWTQKLNGNTLELCSGNTECLRTANSDDYKAIKTRKGHFDFVKLKWSTKYSVWLKGAASVGETIIKTFTTPSCEQFQQKHPAVVKVKC